MSKHCHSKNRCRINENIGTETDESIWNFRFRNENFYYGIASGSLNNDGYSLNQFTGDTKIGSTEISSDTTSIILTKFNQEGEPKGTKLLWTYDGIREGIQFANIELDNLGNIWIISIFTGQLTLSNGFILFDQLGEYVLIKTDRCGEIKLVFQLNGFSLNPINLSSDGINIYLIGTFDKRGEITKITDSSFPDFIDTSITDIPVTSITDIPVTSITDIPITSITDIPVTSITDIPITSITDIPVTSITDIPTTCDPPNSLESITLFDSTSCPIESQLSAGIIKLSTNGNIVWVKSLIGKGVVTGNGISIDRINRLVIVGGTFDLTISVCQSINCQFTKRTSVKREKYWLGNKKIKNQTSRENSWITFLTLDGRLVKIYCNSHFVIPKHVGKSNDRLALQFLRNDNQGNIYITGKIHGSYKFDRVLTSSSPGYFVAKLSSGGRWIWSRLISVSSKRPVICDITSTFPANCETSLISVNVSSLDDSRLATDISNGNTYVTGYFIRQAVFLSGDDRAEFIINQSNVNLNFFVAKITSDGDWIWVTNINNTVINKSNPISIDNNLYVSRNDAKIKGDALFSRLNS